MSDGLQKLPPKKEVAIALLEGPSMFVHLDPRRQGVVVPKHFMANPQLVLQIGLNMVIPIPDLVVDDDGITCTLSFGRSPFWCKMPWSAIYALVGEDGRGMMWPNDIPPEVVAQMQNPQKEAGPSKPQAKKQRARLAAVGEERDPKAREAEKSEPRADKPAEGARHGNVKQLRPTPAAAPAPAPAPAPAAASGDEPADEGTQEPARPQANPPAGRKPKRELPPYLRVIK